MLQKFLYGDICKGILFGIFIMPDCILIGGGKEGSWNPKIIQIQWGQIPYPNFIISINRGDGRQFQIWDFRIFGAVWNWNFTYFGIWTIWNSNLVFLDPSTTPQNRHNGLCATFQWQFFTTVCSLFIWNAFQQISSQPDFIASWGFHHWTQNQNYDIFWQFFVLL